MYYCPECKMWLNGPPQWEDHKIGKPSSRSRLSRIGTLSLANDPEAPEVSSFRCGRRFFIGLKDMRLE